MNKSLLLFVAIAISFSTYGQTINTVPVNSNVDEVKLYLGGAQVTRTANVSLTNGTSKIIFKDLPNTLDASTFSVDGRGDFTILSILQGYSNEKRRLPKEAQVLQDSLTLLMAQKEDIVVLQNILEEEERFLNANLSIGGQQSGINPTELKDAANFYRARLGEIKKGQLLHRREVAELNKEIERLKAKLYPFSSDRVALNQELAVTVSANKATNAKITVSYYTTSASWNPMYDIRTDGFGEPVELILKASARNITGEDWSDTKFTFSTGQPTLGATPPTINPWFLRPIAAPPVSSMPQTYSNRDRAEPELLAQDEITEHAGSSADYTVKQDAITATDYSLPVNYQLESGKDPLIVEIEKQQLEAAYEYFAIPKKSFNAYLLAKIPNTEQLNLLSGKASIYLEGAYTGSANLSSSMSADTLLLPLGVDKAIKVERVRIKDYKSKKFIGSKVEETVGWDINIRNGKRVPVKIKISDQIPVSTDRSISVEPEETTDGDINKDTGMVTWILNLKSSEKRTLKLGYKVQYPKDMRIVLE
ncbi:MAG: DUF4139 domain-containing protein [Bacteroidales bacterium]